MSLVITITVTESDGVFSASISDPLVEFEVASGDGDDVRSAVLDALDSLEASTRETMEIFLNVLRKIQGEGDESIT